MVLQRPIHAGEDVLQKPAADLGHPEEPGATAEQASRQRPLDRSPAPGGDSG